MVSKFFPYAPTFFVREETERNSRVIASMRASLAFVRISELFVLCTRLLLSLIALRSMCQQTSSTSCIRNAADTSLPPPDDFCLILAHPSTYSFFTLPPAFSLTRVLIHRVYLSSLARPLSPFSLSPSSLSSRITSSLQLVSVPFPSHFSSSHVPDDLVRVGSCESLHSSSTTNLRTGTLRILETEQRHRYSHL